MSNYQNTTDLRIIGLTGLILLAELAALYVKDFFLK